MQLSKIINTCTHDLVAEAAVASIGSDFSRRIGQRAAVREMSTGAYVGSMVLKFSWRSGDAELRALSQAMLGASTPVLAGLRHILDITTAEEDEREERQLKHNGRFRFDAVA